MLLTNVATLFVGFGMFGSFLLIPQLAELPESTGFGFGLDATGAGLLLLPGALMMLVTGPISGALGTRFGSKLPLAIGAADDEPRAARPRAEPRLRPGRDRWATVMSTGIGLAFAAMANLIVEAVPPAQTGEATGINTLTRSVGASIGSQVSAAILAGSAVAGSPSPTDDGFTAAFLVSAAVAAIWRPASRS